MRMAPLSTLSTRTEGQEAAAESGWANLERGIRLCGKRFSYLPLAQVVHELLHVDLVQQDKVRYARLPLHGHVYAFLFCSQAAESTGAREREREVGGERRRNT